MKKNVKIPQNTNKKNTFKHLKNLKVKLEMKSKENGEI